MSILTPSSCPEALLEKVTGDGPDTCAVIAAGGKGTRLGGRRAKQYIDICGLPMISWSLIAFDSAPSVGHIVIVCAGERIEEIQQRALAPIWLSTPITFAPAGESRQRSCLSGLYAVPEKYPLVAIHDAARPLITPQTIERVIAEVRGNQQLAGAICAHPSVDTLKLVEDRNVIATTDRSVYWCVQTPQVFRREVVTAAHEEAVAKGYEGTDDSSLVELAGGLVRCVDAQRDNFKVTVASDLRLAAAILDQRLVSAGYGNDEEDEWL